MSRRSAAGREEAEERDTAFEAGGGRRWKDFSMPLEAVSTLRWGAATAPPGRLSGRRELLLFGRIVGGEVAEGVLDSVEQEFEDVGDGEDVFGVSEA